MPFHVKGNTLGPDVIQAFLKLKRTALQVSVVSNLNIHMHYYDTLDQRKCYAIFFQAIVVKLYHCTLSVMVEVKTATLPPQMATLGRDGLLPSTSLLSS